VKKKLFTFPANPFSMFASRVAKSDQLTQLLARAICRVASRTLGEAARQLEPHR
jgi:hypothetical protein